MFENSFLKNGKLKFWSEVLIFSIQTYSSYEINWMKLKLDFYENRY